jgi:hypothetical protein
MIKPTVIPTCNFHLHGYPGAAFDRFAVDHFLGSEGGSQLPAQYHFIQVGAGKLFPPGIIHIQKIFIGGHYPQPVTVKCFYPEFFNEGLVNIQSLFKIAHEHYSDHIVPVKQHKIIVYRMIQLGIIKAGLNNAMKAVCKYELLSVTMPS